MNKFLMSSAVLALTATAVSADEVRVYNWSDYIDEALLEKFEADTGLELVYDVFDSNEVLETKMTRAGLETQIREALVIRETRARIGLVTTIIKTK